MQVSGDQIELTNFSEISSATEGEGDGGSITVSASRLTMSRSDIVAITEDAGKGGDMKVTADQIELTNFSEISTATEGEGDGGVDQFAAVDRAGGDVGSVVLILPLCRYFGGT